MHCLMQNAHERETGRFVVSEHGQRQYQRQHNVHIGTVAVVVSDATGSDLYTAIKPRHRLERCCR